MNHAQPPRPRVFVVAQPGREQHRKVGFNPSLSTETPSGTSFVDVRGRVQMGVDAAELESRLTAWVRWEATASAALVPTHARQLRGPTRIVRPHKPNTPLNHQHQVTDPVLFDGPFIYSLTRQDRYERLRALIPGDLVIFGARSHRGFLLDTVFVVGQKHSHAQGRAKQPEGSTALQVSVGPLLQPADGLDDGAQLAQAKKAELERLSWYLGATPSSKIDGMFSFTPALPHDGTPKAFSRLVVSDCAGITNTMPVQYLQAPPQEVWSALAERTCASGLGLATALHTWPHPAATGPAA